MKGWSSLTLVARSKLAFRALETDRTPQKHGLFIDLKFKLSILLYNWGCMFASNPEITTLGLKG